MWRLGFTRLSPHVVHAMQGHMPLRRFFSGSALLSGCGVGFSSIRFLHVSPYCFDALDGRNFAAVAVCSCSKWALEIPCLISEPVTVTTELSANCFACYYAEGAYISAT